MSAPKVMVAAELDYLRHLANDGRDLYAMALSAASGDRIVAGLLSGAPTTASTQATGATGITAWRVNVDKGLFTVGGKMLELAAAADVVIASANVSLINGDSMVAALVVYNNAGTATLATVRGAAAVTGSQVAPTSAAITTALSTPNWVLLAYATINRTGDTTVTQSQDNTVGYRGLML